MNTGQKSSRPFGDVQRNTDLFLRIKSCRNQFKLKKCKADSLKIFKTHICLSNLGEESNMTLVWINTVMSPLKASVVMNPSAVYLQSDTKSKHTNEDLT